MKFLNILSYFLILALVLTILISLKNPTLSRSAENIASEYLQIKNVAVDKNYLLALNSADNFLCAWLMRDQKKGEEFITKRLKDSLTYNELFAFFVGTSNPHNQGFEIIGEKHLSNKRIRFFVWLYEYYTMDNPKPYLRKSPYYIDVVKFDEYRWLVDTLPKPYIK
ncbi:MAG: hypothetical protein N2749_04015 [Clostridia bacterium]|nr:hypothetical protein [Clostridia bacterium]